VLKLRLLTLVFPILFLACNRPPEACIDNAQTSVAAGTPVTFTSCSKRTLSQDWYIDGPVGAPEDTMAWSDAQFTHTFTVPGSYTVTLNAYSKFSFLGDVSTTTQSVTIN
jgi:plastocyanin